jgi:hypothetical protein
MPGFFFLGLLVGANLFAHSSLFVRINSHLQTPDFPGDPEELRNKLRSYNGAKFLTEYPSSTGYTIKAGATNHSSA